MNTRPSILRAGIAAVLVSIGSAALAQVYPTPPEPGAPREVAIATPFEARLPNGLRVIVAERRGLPLATATLIVRAGSEFDPPARAGLAATTATLLATGTRTRTAPEIAQAAEALGSSIDTSAAWHASSISMTVTVPKLDAALALIADLAMHPAFAPDEVARVRQQSLDALRVAYSEPGSVARIAAAHAVFGAGAYGHPIAGTPASIAHFTRDDLVRLHRRVVRPDNAVLVLAGNVAPQDAVALATARFGAWKAPSAALPKLPQTLGTPSSAPILAIDMPGAGQAGVVVALPGIARDAPDYDAGQVANALLGGGYSSRLSQEIRIKRGLSYDASSVLDTRRAGGLITLAAQTKNPSAAEVVGLMRDALRQIAETAPGADELDARKATLIGGVSRSVETTAGLARRVGTLAIDDVPLDEIGRTIGKLQAVTPAQVHTFAQRHWRAADARVAVAGDAKVFAADLERIEARTLVVPVSQLDAGRGDAVAATPPK